MLGRLPHEVLIRVIAYLPFYPKLSLMMTCHKLYNIIFKTRLLEDIHLLPQHQDMLMKCFEDEVFDSTKVKTMHFASTFLDTTKYVECLALFTNIEEISLYKPVINRREIPVEALERLVFFKDSIKTYSDTKSPLFIRQLIQTYPFTRLLRLSLDGSKGHTYNPIDIVRNTPPLNSLELSHFNITIDLIEELHEVCENLNHLKLSSMTLNLINITLPDPITPATSLESLNSTLFVVNDISCKFIRYIIDKYPNLRSLDINRWLDMPRLRARWGFVTHVSSPTYKSYRRNLPSLMVELAPRLYSLHIEPYLFDDFINTMSSITDNIRTIGFYSSGNRSDIFDHLRRTHRFLTSLTSLTSLSLEIKFAKFLYKKRYHHPNIKSLYLHQINPWKTGLTFHLDRILSTYNGLETFSFDCPLITLDIDEENITNAPSYPSLKIMNLNTNSNFRDILGYVRNCLPNIRELEWKDLSWSNSGDEQVQRQVTLPEHTFDNLNLYCPTYQHNHAGRIQNIRITYNITQEEGFKTVHLATRNSFSNGRLNKQSKVTVDLGRQDANDEAIQIDIHCKELKGLHNDDIIIF